MYCDYRLLARALMPSPNYIQMWMKQDNKIMAGFGIANHAINYGKYRNNKLKQRLKRSAVQNQFIDCFLDKFAKRIHTIISIKNKLILDYFATYFNYDNIMAELDKLLWKEKPSEKIGRMVKQHFISLQACIDKYAGQEWGLCKATQEHTYLTKNGIYKYHTRFGREFYLRTGTPPFTITIIER